MSASVGARRNARRASVETICFAHARFVGRRRRAADEHPPRLGVSPRPVGVVRPGDHDARQVRRRGVAVLHADEDVVGARHRTTNQVLVGGVCLLQERDADRLRPGLHLQPELEADVGRHLHPLLERIGRLRLRRMRARRLAHEEHRHFVELEQLHALAVERHLELFALGALAEHLAETELQQRQPDHVLAVDREVVRDGRAAARAERLAFERLVLAEIALHRVGDLRRRGVAFADGQPADLRRRRDVALEQRRRHAEHVGDVVEAVARIVGRQQGGGIDVERQQIADRVLVLDAVHAVQRRASGIGAGRRGAIDGVLDRAGEGVERGALGPLGAGGRHQAGAHLADHLLPDLRVGAAIGREAFEREAAGLQRDRCGR